MVHAVRVEFNYDLPAYSDEEGRIPARIIRSGGVSRKGTLSNDAGDALFILLANEPTADQKAAIMDSIGTYQHNLMPYGPSDWDEDSVDYLDDGAVTLRVTDVSFVELDSTKHLNYSVAVAKRNAQ